MLLGDAYADMLVPLSQITMSTPSFSRTRSIARTQPGSADPSTSSRRMPTPPTSSSKNSSPPTRTMSLDSSSLGLALSLSCSLRSRRCSRRTLRRRLRRSRIRFELMLLREPRSGRICVDTLLNLRFSFGECVQCCVIRTSIGRRDDLNAKRPVAPLVEPYAARAGRVGVRTRCTAAPVSLLTTLHLRDVRLTHQPQSCSLTFR